MQWICSTYSVQFCVKSQVLTAAKQARKITNICMFYCFMKYSTILQYSSSENEQPSLLEMP